MENTEYPFDPEYTAQIVAECPKCGEEVSQDGWEVVNIAEEGQPEELALIGLFRCEECGISWSRAVQ